MLFNSYEFIFIFFPTTLFFYFLLARQNKVYGVAWLMVASIFFYSWWNPKFTSLLLISIAFNFTSGLLISKSNKNKLIFIAAVAINLLFLIYLKYANFFIGSINGLGGHLEPIQLILPLGISFFTFTQIAFLVDCLRGDTKEFNPLNYILFVTWFPHLIAGPILHHKEMMPQFSSKTNSAPNNNYISTGLTIFSIGLFKKVLLADQFSPFVSQVFNMPNPIDPMFFESWIAVLSYTLQLYFDFSAYSDMAIGLSLMFNIVLPKNFDSPYKSASIIDFWRRWHMTLSRFLRDYLYFPLGGNRNGKIRRHFNLFITMILGGMWHGAGWGFIIWGGLHGVFLAINHFWRATFLSQIGEGKPITKVIGIAITFTAVSWSWVPFRANSIKSTLAIWSGMIGLNGFEATVSMTMMKEYALIIVGLGIVWFMPNLMTLLPKNSSGGHLSEQTFFRFNLITAIIVGAILCISVLSINHASEFLYFQF